MTQRSPERYPEDTRAEDVHAIVSQRAEAIGAPAPLAGAVGALTQDRAVAEPKRARWRALDMLRFTAVVLMVQGHTFYVVLSEAARDAAWYRWHSYVHGYTAPAFLFAAGLAFGVTTFPKWQAHVAWGPTVRKRLFRYALIIFIGYVIHLPGMSLVQAMQVGEPERIHRMLRVDALQHIGVSLLICQGLVALLRDRRRYVLVLATLAAVVVLLGPWAWRQPFAEHLPVGIAAYLNASTGSLFPILPWAGFVFCGVLVGYVASGERRDGGLRIEERLALVAAAFAVSGFLLHESGFDPFGEHNFWKTSPYFFLRRMGTVLAFLSLLCLAERGVRRLRGGSAPTWLGRTVGVMGQETLVVYVAHLLILYGSPLRRGLHRDLWHSLPLGGAALVFLILLAAMVALAWGWHWAKTDRPRLFTGVRWALWAALLWMLVQA
ncbi:MAG: heparan-alpha-glucosaminide N-acetyltransferase domain-containing protein [Polyangiales bacterium]